LTELNSLPGVSIRPSAFDYNEEPPQIEGLSAGTNVTVGDRGTCPAILNHVPCEGAGCRRCWDDPSSAVSYGYHDPESLNRTVPPNSRFENLQQLEQLGHHRRVDRILFKMAQIEDDDDAPLNLEEDLEYSPGGIDIIQQILAKWGATNVRTVFPDVIAYDYNGQIYVIDDLQFPDPKDAHQWIWDLWEDSLEEYAPQPDFNKEFWQGGGKVYHGTTEENWEEIQQDGELRIKDETRGLYNRGTGAAIFASYNPGDTDSYGEVTLEIDVGQMIADAYTPQVSKEGPLDTAEMRRSIAYRLGIEDFYDDSASSDGYSEDTVIFHKNIPLKYIRAIDMDDRPRY